MGAGRENGLLGRYRWYVLALLTAAQGCHALDRAIIGLVLEPVRQEFKVSDSQLGVLAGLGYGAAFAAAAIPMGLLVDRTNRKRLLGVLLALWSGLTALCGLASNYVQLLVARMAVGVAESGGAPTGMSILADYFRPSERAGAVGIWYLSSAIGIIGTYLVGGFVAAQFGWRAAFFVAGAPGLLLAAVIFATLREPRRGASDPPGQAVEAAKPMGLFRGLAYIARRPTIMSVMLAIGFMSIAQSATATWMASFLVRAHGYSLPMAGIIGAVTMGVLAPLGASAVGLAVDRRNQARGYDLSRVAMACVFTTTASALLGAGAVAMQSQAAMLVLLGGYTMLQAGHNGAANSMLVTLAGANVRGFVMSTLQVLTNLFGWGLGPVIVGAVSDRVGGAHSLQWGLLAVILFQFLAGLSFFLVTRSRRAVPA